MPIVLVALATPALAQQTREQLIIQQEAEKAARLEPEQPSKAQGYVMRAERALQAAPVGLYPWIGSVLPGGLLAVGPGVRLPFARTGAFDAHGAWSLKNYKLAAASATLPRLADGRVRAAVHADIIDAPGFNFYGTGNDTTRDDRTTFLFRPASVGGALSLHPVARVDLGGALDYLAIDTALDSGSRPMGQRLTPAEAPGLGADPDYVRATAFAGYDWRESPGYTRHGGLYRVTFSNFAQRDGAALSFRRVDVEARQFIPILRENWIIALRGAVSTTATEPGRQVPYFLMPDLGGGSSLRGYSSWRFRDRHSLLLSAEYRWTPSQFLDMAIFTDAGKVASERRDLDLSGLHHSYGIGARFHTPSATPLRIDIARGDDGLAIIFAVNQPF